MFRFATELCDEDWRLSVREPCGDGAAAHLRTVLTWLLWFALRGIYRLVMR
jgi:hypothetical protein